MWCLYDQQFNTKAFIFHMSMCCMLNYLSATWGMYANFSKLTLPCMILKLFVHIIDFISIFGNTCSMNFTTLQAIYGRSLCFFSSNTQESCVPLYWERETSPLQRSPPHSAVWGEKYMLSGSLLKFNFYDFRKRFATLSVVWDKLFCKFWISVYTFHLCFYGTYAGKTNKTNKDMRNKKYFKSNSITLCCQPTFYIN